MKTKTLLTLLTALFTLIFVFPLDTVGQIKSQGPPDWAPANGYRENTRYVYFPDKNFYYDVHQQQYIYKSGFNWRKSSQLPTVYRRVDLGTARKVELDLNSDMPYKQNSTHRTSYKVNPKSSQAKQNNNPGKGKNPRKGK